jgi:hypothetical protein
MVESKEKVLCQMWIPLVCHMWITSCLCSAPECTVFASQQDSGLSNTVAAQSEPEKHSLLSLLVLGLAHSRNPPKQGVGFLSVPHFCTSQPGCCD